MTGDGPHSPGSPGPEADGPVPGPRGARVGLAWHPDCLGHVNGPGHPESPDRLLAIRARLETTGLLDRLEVIEPQPCPPALLARVHTPQHIERIRRACAHAPARLDPDTGVSEGSWRAALLSAGGAVAACDAVMQGRVSAAFVATRPPGHHAEADRAMGFCLFNNIAVAARHLQEAHRVGKVFIVDWDVHHGNASQHMFEDDDSVFYFSTHAYPFYPGTGARSERGSGRGAGFTLNVPMPAGSGDAEYLAVFNETLVPALEEFRPGFVLVSAGFDAHRDDPLAGMALTEAGYAGLTGIVRDAAQRLCGGRIVSLLEGGYDLRGLAASVEAHLRALGAA
jgi:acetoin utilization deacetylase AcuC-like enzyme